MDAPDLEQLRREARAALIAELVTELRDAAATLGADAACEVEAVARGLETLAAWHPKPRPLAVGDAVHVVGKIVQRDEHGAFVVAGAAGQWLPFAVLCRVPTLWSDHAQ